MAFTWSENITTGVAIKASHLTELQNNVDTCDGLVCYGENTSFLEAAYDIACDADYSSKYVEELSTENGEAWSGENTSNLGTKDSTDRDPYNSSELGTYKSGEVSNVDLEHDGTHNDFADATENNNQVVFVNGDFYSCLYE